MEANLIDYAGPLVPIDADDKPLAIALRELVEDKLELRANEA